MLRIYFPLNTLLESVAYLIREQRSSLEDLQLLDLDPDLQKVYGRFQGDEVVITNEFHSARGFRQIHLEIARLGSQLQILHCVFFPEPTYDLPIFGVDIVGGPQEISAAIVDLSPVSTHLPESIEKKLKTLNDFSFDEVRQLPEWGNIFSPYVCFVRPKNLNEKNSFSKLVQNYLTTLISHSLTIDCDFPHSPFTIDRYKNQQFYCLQQKRNDKTRQVLARMFSPHWADQYIDLVLFNCPNGYLEKMS